MRRLAVGVDVDGVLADAVSTIHQYAKEKYGITIRAIETYNPAFPMPDGSTVDLNRLFDEAFSDPVYMQAIAPIPGAADGMAYLAQTHDVVIITSRKPKVSVATLKWVRANIGDYPVVFSRVHNKSDHGMDVLVDDRLKFIDHFVEKNPDKHAIIYSQPWNQRPVAEWQPRTFYAENWNEVVRRVDWIADNGDKRLVPE